MAAVSSAPSAGGPSASSPSASSPGAGGLSAEVVKKDFPILVHPAPSGRRLVYLDSAASSQKPTAVLEAMQHYYETSHANVHRGVYAIAEEATRLFEQARSKVARFVRASSTREIVFTKNATEACNLVARSWGGANLREGDAVLLTEMEHHANLVPWLQLKAERGIELRYLPFDEHGVLDLTDLDRLLDGVSLVGLTAMSNVLGTLNPVRRVADAAHAAGAVVLVDASQYVPHLATDVAALGCDLMAFTGHKMLGPTGIGVLWGRESLLDAMPPFLGGGEMIRDVRLDGFVPNELPWKFEAGTPPIAEAVGLGAAVDYLEGLGMPAVRQHEEALTAYALRTLGERYGTDLTVHGPVDPALRGGVLSFAYKDIHPHDLSQVLDEAGVCVRAGHHCAKPLMRRLGVGATARASFYVYNDEADVDALADALAGADRLFAGPLAGGPLAGGPLSGSALTGSALTGGALPGGVLAGGGK
jgi:cysteine desulfurase/selenocysteine lyase